MMYIEKMLRRSTLYLDIYMNTDLKLGGNLSCDNGKAIYIEVNFLPIHIEFGILMFGMKDIEDIEYEKLKQQRENDKED